MFTCQRKAQCQLISKLSISADLSVLSQSDLEKLLKTDNDASCFTMLDLLNSRVRNLML